MDASQLALAVFAGINLFAFVLVGVDKKHALHRNTHKRTPEGFLFFLATAFGAIGVYLAMQLFRHKTKKWYFQLGLPLLIVHNLATLYLIRMWWL